METLSIDWAWFHDINYYCRQTNAFFIDEDCDRFVYEAVCETETYSPYELPIHLVGAWAWENDSSWVTVINADGSGSRGFPDDIVYFTWRVETETRRMWKVRPHGQREIWTYELDGNILTLTNWFREGGEERSQSFRYILVD